MTEEKLGPRAGNRPLKKWVLTLLLVGLATVPSLATVGLWMTAPRVKEGELPVAYMFYDVGDEQFYAQPAESREPLDDPRLQITNVGAKAISNFNVVLNHAHEIRDPHLVLEPQQSVTYRLRRFYNRAGIPFVPELNPIKHIRIFAKQADQSRASIHQEVLAEKTTAQGSNRP
ncbi:MAG: hypothetical protein JNL67_17260 [Planctomycetaceae bacterium]|nr:hypothetical protein [Planctomycetaceae bacterium]